MKKVVIFEVLCAEEMWQIRGGGDDNERDQQGMPVPPPLPPAKTLDELG